VGADLKDGRGSVGEWPGTFWEIPTINSFESGLEIWKPTIAAVPGYCLGYGLTTVLRCDFVIAADDAEFGFPEVGLGVPTIIGAMRLPGRVGWSNAMELLLTGERVDATAAKEMGLVWKVVPRDALMDEAAALARRLVAAAPLAQRATKEMAARGGHLPWEDAVRLGESMRRVVGASEDAAEGMRAAREGRAPEWRGR
jgi:E-phenylitaconyl-CoA hydratase